jgi:hypothetical protein
LLGSPNFDNYALKEYSRLDCPPIHQLSTGADHATTFWQLGSPPIEGGSYQGNDLVLAEILKLMHGGTLSTDDEIKIAAGAIPVVGDQLTISRDQQLKNLRAGDRNSFDRLRWLTLSLGFFHVEMILASSILQNHRGTHSSFGLARDISKIGIKGLASQTEKPYFHTVDDLLLFESIARIRGLWLWASGTESLQELRSMLDDQGAQAPATIRAWAEKILTQRASSSALADLEMASEDDDPVLKQSILLVRDLLFYKEVREVIRQGDVGHLENLGSPPPSRNLFQRSWKQKLQQVDH